MKGSDQECDQYNPVEDQLIISDITVSNQHDID
jgi:hypothetical protein